jgi:branched-chain amino acid transport system substrate-binding protein
MGAAAFTGVVAGGAGGFLGGRSSAGGAVDVKKGSAITIGALVPITGSSAGDGETMLNGMRLAMDELNAAGGIGGRPIQMQLLDAGDQVPSVMVAAMRKFVSDKVAAVFSPFLTYTNVDLAVVGPATIPTFHVNTFQGNVDFAIKHGFKNIFQGCPSEIWYANGFATVLDSLIAAKKFEPRKKTASIITSNDAYSTAVALTLRGNLQKQGWKIVTYDSYTSPQSEWGPVLTRITQDNPDLIFFSNYFPGDEASFIKQFAQSPTKSLVYELYAPSVPEYLTLAGKAANGVMWATTTGSILDDDVGERFSAAYHKKYNQPPGLSNAGAQYDLIHIWAQAAALAPDPYDYNAVGDNVRYGIYRGVNGSYKMGPTAQTCLPYPAYTKDPTLGMPLLTYQIQDGKQVLVNPTPYTSGNFQTPPWLS